MIDYKEIDRTSQYQYRQERLELANKYGYDTIAESIVRIYRMTGSSSKTGALLGGISSQGILRFLKKIGEPTNGAGGYHR